MYPKTRAEARSAGAKHYFTGKPCKNGHTEIRATRNGECHDCSKIRAKKIYSRDIESSRRKGRERAAERRLKNPERVRMVQNRWYEKNREKVSESRKLARIKNPGLEKERYRKNREYFREKCREWRDRNPGYFRDYYLDNPEIYRKGVKKRSKKITEGAPWGKVSKWVKIQEKVCEYCKIQCGENFHVDHYIPFQKVGATR